MVLRQAGSLNQVAKQAEEVDIGLVNEAALAQILEIEVNVVHDLAEKGVLKRTADGRFPLAPSIIAWHQNHPNDSSAKSQQGTSACLGSSGSTRSGIATFDKTFGGYVDGTLNLLSTQDHDVGTAAIAAYLAAGLNNGERVALASFKHPKHTFAKFATYGFGGFERYLDSEQLIYLYYKPMLSKSLCLSLDYRRLFDEIERISGKPLSRLALDNCEALFNLQSDQLARTSAVKLMLAAEHKQYATLGTFVRPIQGEEVDIDRICQSVLASYLSVDTISAATGQYRFTIRKSPRLTIGRSFTVNLLGGDGFVTDRKTDCTGPERTAADTEYRVLSFQHFGGIGNRHARP